MAINAETTYRTNRFQEEALPHMDSVYRCALHMAKNESDARDLVQETYLRAYRFFDKFKDGTNCRAWLIKILRNSFINTIRRAGKHQQMVYISEREEHGIGLLGDDDPETNVFANLFDDDITAAMDSLPIHYRTTVLLADVEGFSYREIAEIIDCPIGTVMSRLSRGRQLLRERLHDYAVRHGYF